MSYTLTEQQLAIINFVVNPTAPILTVNAVAGASKSTTLQEAAKALQLANPSAKFHYLVYGALAGDEARKAFGTTAAATNVHKLAYRYTIGSSTMHLLQAPFISWMDIPKRIHQPFGRTFETTELVKAYCQSPYTDFDTFLSTIDRQAPVVKKLALEIMGAMHTGEMGCTHDFYMKVFHMEVVNGTLSLPECDVLAIDECLPGYMYINTSTGSRTIKSVVKDLQDNKPVLVKSYNRQFDDFEYKPASNPLVSPNREVLQITTEGLNKINCTPNHKILTQRGWIRADKLTVGIDRVILDSNTNQKAKYVLNSEQEQVVLGSFLGDGSIVKQSKFNTYRCRFTHGDKQLQYLQWKAASLNCTTHYKGTSGYTGKKTINYVNSPTFILDYELNLANVLERIGPLALAIWVMDDGSTSTDNAMSIHSNSFTEEENYMITSTLNTSFSVNATVHKTRDYYYLKLTKQESSKLTDIIEKYIHSDLLYKFNLEESIAQTLNNTYRNHASNFVASVEYLETTTVYDFEVADNHNFCTSISKNSVQTVVHNCQDLNQITLDIFQHYPAKLKVLVGDPTQAIFQFLGCINAFDLYPHACTLHLHRSFRCNTAIADRVQAFCRATIDPNFMFEGSTYADETITTKAYLTRTNAALIEKMVELRENKIPYKLATPSKAKQMFEVPLALLRCKPGNKEKSSKYKAIQASVDKWAKDKALQKIYPSRLQYVASEFKENPEIVPSVQLIRTHSPETVIDVYNTTMSHKPHEAEISLLTVHTSKGMTYDSVELAPDLDKGLKPIMQKFSSQSKYKPTAEELPELYLYYVACTRARYEVVNATHM